MYRKVQDSVKAYEQQLDAIRSEGFLLKNSVSEGLATTAHERRITLLAINFEAILHIPQTTYELRPDVTTNDVVGYRQVLLLDTQIVAARNIQAPAKTYTLFADMVLSAVVGGGGDDRTEPLITVDLAASLLQQLISTARSTRAYSIKQASHWIRCLVQMLVDSHKTATKQTTSSGQGESDIEHLKLVEEVVDQAIILAGNAGDERRQQTQQDVPMHDADTVTRVATELLYPADELEWLATTVFNLAVDFFVSEREDDAKRWSRKAVAVADVLAASEDGDGGSLTKVLRAKIGELGWVA